MEIELKNNTFNEMVNYILRKYAGQINRSNASKIAARHLGEDMLLLDATLDDEVEQFLEGPTAKKQKFKSRDFIQGAKKAYSEWKEEQVTKTDYNPPSAPEPPEPGGTTPGEDDWTDYDDPSKGLDDLLSHLEELITARDTDLESYYEKSYNLIEYIITESRRLHGDEFTWEKLNAVAPGLKNDLTSLVYAISDGTYAIWSMGLSAYRSAIQILEDELKVDGSPMHFW